MIDLLIADLDKEVQEIQVEEKDAQSEYETFMSYSATKRADDSASIAEKESAKADAESALNKAESDKKSTVNEAMGKAEEISALHGECDWLISNFEARKEARAGEVESLKNAKSVLSGADYSLAQTHRTVKIHAQTCPSTSFACGMTKDAAGDRVFVPHALPAPDTCVNVASDMPADGEFKICGPGTFSISRISCERHDYKAVTISHATDAFTQSDCQTYKLSDYPEIHGYIGSAQYSCGATAR